MFCRSHPIKMAGFSLLRPCCRRLSQISLLQQQGRVMPLVLVAVATDSSFLCAYDWLEFPANQSPKSTVPMFSIM